MQYVPVPVGSTGVVVLCLDNGCVSIEITPAFTPFAGYAADNINEIFDYEGFSLAIPGQDFMSYSYQTQYKYKDLPVLKAWLQQQNLVNPV